MVFGLAILAAALSAPPQAETGRLMSVTGQVTSVYAHLPVLNVGGKHICVHCPPGKVRTGDIIAATCKRYSDGTPKPFWEITSHEVLGHADVPPPRNVTVEQLVREKPFFATVRFQCTVEDIQQDDTALDSFLVTLRSGSSRIQATITSEERKRIRNFDKLLNATIELSGIYFDSISSSRPFHGPVFVLTDYESIRIINSRQSDLFNQPPFAIDEAVAPNDIAELGLRTATGTVLACWETRHVLLKTEGKRGTTVHHLTLAFGIPLPEVGAKIQIVGQPETDFYRINFTSVRYRRIPDAPAGATDYGAVNEGLSNLFHVTDGKTVYHDTAYGRLFHVRGTLTSRAVSKADARISLLVDGVQVNVDAASCPKALEALQPGSVLDVVGVCILDIDNWRPGTFLPPIKGYRLVLRNARDLTVVRVPSWWTPARFVSVIAGLFALLVGTLIWNRTLNRLVTRRSRELAREKAAHMASELRIGERTRLAVELHDTLSQNLTGVTFHIASARNAIGTADEAAKSRLTSAERILRSCHTELRNVLSDLRSSALEEKDFATAIRTVLKGVEDLTDVAVRFDVPRAKLMDSTAHAILCIVRELVGNAVRHGKPSHVAVTGALDSGLLRVEVREDGCGFDPAHCDGPGEGHFGLDGIRSRIQRLGGTFALTSAPGEGSRAIVEIPLAATAEQGN